MKKYKCWVEYEETIEANNLGDALAEFEKNLNVHDLEINGCEIKKYKGDK
jgi:hypothetical protein